MGDIRERPPCISWFECAANRPGSFVRHRLAPRDEYRCALYKVRLRWPIGDGWPTRCAACRKEWPGEDRDPRNVEVPQ
jgi:hypothetical protein